MYWVKHRKDKPSPAAIRERVWAGDNTTSSFIPSTKVPYKTNNYSVVLFRIGKIFIDIKHMVLKTKKKGILYGIMNKIGQITY